MIICRNFLRNPHPEQSYRPEIFCIKDRVADKFQNQNNPRCWLVKCRLTVKLKFHPKKPSILRKVGLHFRNLAMVLLEGDMVSKSNSYLMYYLPFSVVIFSVLVSVPIDTYV